MDKNTANTGFSRIVAFDPGGTTGIAVAQYSAKTCSFVVGMGFQVEHRRMLPWLKAHDAWWNAGVAIVIEDFTLRPNAPGGGRRESGLSAVAIGGQINGYLAHTMAERTGDGRVYWQGASIAKTTMTDDRLRRRAMWIKGRQHTRDALRHLVVFCMKRDLQVHMGEHAQMYCEF